MQDFSNSITNALELLSHRYMHHWVTVIWTINYEKVGTFQWLAYKHLELVTFLKLCSIWLYCWTIMNDLWIIPHPAFFLLCCISIEVNKVSPRRSILWFSLMGSVLDCSLFGMGLVLLTSSVLWRQHIVQNRSQQLVSINVLWSAF